MIDAESALPAVDVELTRLGERLASLRLCDAPALEAMRRSLVAHGQLSPLVVFAAGEGFEIVDGFKRVRAARALGWIAVRAHVASVGTIEAKLLIAALHDGRGLTELEEGWLVRSLYRDDHLQQPAIAHRLGRHKSWVCRRLMLVEALDPAVQGDVRLGLIAPRAAITVGQLPRGNQHPAAGVVIRRGLTVRQTELLVAELLDLPNDAARAARIAAVADGTPPGARVRPSPATRSEADWIAHDIATVRAAGARLQARLLGAPLVTLEPSAAQLLGESLDGLVPVLDALTRTIARVTAKEHAA